MFNRYTCDFRAGPLATEEEKEAQTKLAKKRKERRKRQNDEFAARAKNRQETWMATAVDTEADGNEESQNVIGFEFRKRDKSLELDEAPGKHWITANRYKLQTQRVQEAEDSASAQRDFRAEWQEIRYGESPFRRRVRSEEIHPPLRFKDVTEAERINASTASQVTSLGCAADPLKEPQMGYDHIPVGMRPDTVVVRAKAKCPGAMQFKRTFTGGNMINPRDQYITTQYLNAAEATSYGMTRFNNLRLHHRDGDVDPNKMYLSPVTGDNRCSIGKSSSWRADRRVPPIMDHPARKYYSAAKTAPVWPRDDKAPEVVQGLNLEGNPESKIELATRVLQKHGLHKTRYLETSNTCANGANVYGWNELMKYKDHLA